MKQVNIEEGETRLGCFSDSSNRQFVTHPVCPCCHSNNYSIAEDSIDNCICNDCGTRYHFNFNV